MNLGNDHHILRFGEYSVDPRDHRLYGPSGPIHVGGRALGVLITLLEAEGRLVTKAELFDQVWQGLAVSDAALTSVIRELRIALDDSSKDGLIRAVYGQGYRLELDNLSKPNGSNSGRAPAVAKSPATEPKLAVLPFDDLSPEGNFGYFSDGISEEILSLLTRGSRIGIIGKLSSFAFRGSEKIEAPAKLSATHIVDGSVRRFADHLRLTVHLCEVSSGDALWSESFQIALAELMETQTEIADSIAKKLEQKIIPRPAMNVSRESHELYLKVVGGSLSYGRHQTTIAAMKQITGDSPEFAPAWGLMASALADLRQYRPATDWKLLVDQSEYALAKATSIDPHEPHALSAEMRLTGPYGDYERQRKAIEAMRPVVGYSSGFHYLQSLFLSRIGKMRQAVEFARQARELDPVVNGPGVYLGFALYNAGMLDEAKEVLLDDLEQSPENQFVALALIMSAARTKDRRMFDHVVNPSHQTLFPLDRLGDGIMIARAILEDDDVTSLTIGQGAIDKIRQCGCFDFFSAAAIANNISPTTSHNLIASTAVGPVSLDARDFMSLDSYFLLSACETEIRKDPRFATLCARIGLAKYWVDNDIWPDCADEEELGYNFREAVKKAAEETSPEPMSLAAIQTSKAHE